MEYCGEVLNYSEFKSRVKLYNKDKNLHFYFMALRADEVRKNLLLYFRGSGHYW